MHKLKHLYALTVALFLAAGLSGCAVFQKCSPENCTMDAKIKFDAEALFVEHRELGPPATLHVQSLNGTVYLTGTVDTEFEVRNAESLVRRIANVKDVVNNLNARSNGR
ncbi:MAG: BON domain-containing protein [Pseudomonadota bacterium]|nr:BON domain-containing protein [Pseudomonadota bacterium]